MDLKFEKIDEYNARVELKGVSPSFANALRRILIGEIPVLAIEEVAIKENNSALQDELLAHRLGLLPLKYPVDKIEKLDGVKVTLKKEGPCMVRGEDLKFDKKEISVLYPNIPIVKLIEKQEIDLECICKIGKGKEHAKWQGAIVGYKIDEEKKKIILEIESCSCYTARELMKKALEILKEKAENFAKEFEKSKI